MMRPRSIWPAALLAGWLAAWGPAAAQTLDRMPGYSDARTLREDASLRGVAFGSDSLGVACGDRGVILRSEDGGQSWTHRESGVDCSLNDVVWIDPQRVVIVGGNHDRITQISRGVVLLSEDAGKRWRIVDATELPRLQSVRLAESGSLKASGDWSHSQLGREFESHDQGHSWQVVDPFESPAPPPAAATAAELRQWTAATGAAAAIRNACRVNSQTYCAVGDHGVIALSDDGGHTWRGTRGQRRRTAILFVARDPATVAWSLLGSEALESRNRVALLLAPAPDQTVGSELQIDVVRQAATMLGGSGADQISSDRSRLEQEAGDWIAIHRPSALVLDQSLPGDVRDALFQAATSSGVSRVVSYSRDEGGGTSLHRDALLPRAGVLASDLELDALHYVAPNRAAASSISLRYLYDAVPTARRGETVVGGLSIEQGQRLSAPSQPASRRQLQIAQARLKQSERVAQLIRSSKTRRQFAQSLQATLDQTAREDRFRLAWSVLQQSAAGDSQQRRAIHQQALEEFAKQFPQTTAGRWAQLRSEAMQHSLEWRQLRSALNETQTPDGGSAAQVVAVSPFQVEPSGVRQASAVAPIVVPKPELHELSPRRPPQQVEVDLAWEFHPMKLIWEEAARRRGDEGGLQVAGDQSANLRRLADADLRGWSWLLKPGGPQVVVAQRAGARPRLDGIIDDACWQTASPPTGQPQRLRMAYDDDYIYVAVECPANELRPDSMANEPASSLRDQDLTEVDRLRLRIDIDRDLATSMQLQVTDAGRTHDAIDRNRRWHPTWYVDTHRSDQYVVFELAILRRDLVELPIREGESWFVSAETLRAGSESNDPVIPLPSQWRRVVFGP